MSPQEACGGRGGSPFPGLRLKGSQGCPRGPGRLEPGRGCLPKRLAASPQTQRPLPWAPSPPPLRPPTYLLPNPNSWPSPSPPLLHLQPPLSSPLISQDPIYRQTSGGPEPQAHLPSPLSSGHSLAWNRVRFWAGPRRGWAVGASWPHLAICQVGVGMGPVPGTGDMAVTETGRDSARSRPAQEGPSPEPSTATSTG